MPRELRLLLLIAPVIVPLLVACSGGEGAALFADHCSSCHGQDGRGNGPRAATLQHSPRDLTHCELLTLRTDEELTAVVREGGPALGLSEEMPAFPQLTEPQVRSLVRFVRGFCR